MIAPYSEPASSRFVEWLANLVGSGGAVHIVGGRIVGEQEAQVVIDLRKRRVDDLRGHVVCEDLFHPHVREPAHRDQIAEPHVARLVRDDAGASELLILRGRLVEHQARGVVEDGARVFHAAELKCRHQNEVEFAERVGDLGVAFEPRQRRGMQIEDRVAIARDLRGVGLAVEHAVRAAVALSRLDRKPPRREREQVSRDRLRLGEPHADSPIVRLASYLGAVRDRFPPFRDVEGQRPFALEIRLVDAGKHQMCTGRHEDRVEEIRVAVQRRVSRREREGQPILANRQRLTRNDDVPVDLSDGNCRCVVLDASQQARAIRCEIECQRCVPVGEIERDGQCTEDRLLLGRRDHKRQIVPHVRDPGGPLAREHFADARVGIGRYRRDARRLGQHSDRKQGQDEQNSRAA